MFCFLVIPQNYEKYYSILDIHFSSDTIVGLKPATWLFTDKRHKCRSYLFLNLNTAGYSINQ